MREVEPKEEVTPANGDGAPRRYLPVGIDIAGRNCLVVGGGRVGTRKVLALIEHDAKVTVIAPEISARLHELIHHGSVTWQRGTYESAGLDGFLLVVAATSDPALNISIGRDAEERGALSCVVSPGRFSRLIFPATHVHNGITIAVHSNGRDCAESRRIRDELSRLVDAGKRKQSVLAVFGARLNDLPHHVFETLKQNVSREVAKAMPGTEILVLATCGRWECYFFARAPRRIVRDIMRIAHEKCGLLMESYSSAFYTKCNGAAMYHLLRVAAGLDSPLRGETDIVGQVRVAAAQMTTKSSSPLREVFAAIMQTQNKIRVDSGLSGMARSWAKATVTFLERRISAGLHRVLLLGCGRLGEAITRQLTEKNITVIPFSRRAKTSGVDWCERLGFQPRAPEELVNNLADADAIVLTTELPKNSHSDVLAHFGNGGIIVDLTGNDCFDSPAEVSCVGLEEVGRIPLSGKEAAGMALAERFAFEHVLNWNAKKHRPSGLPPLVRLGGRGSRLSLVQLNEACDFLKILWPGISLENVIIETPGDRDKTTPLPTAQDDFFTRDLDDALLQGKIDVAVHSAKDLPERIRDGLCVIAVTPAFAPWECLVSRGNLQLAELPDGAKVGTSSERRRQRLVELNPQALPTDIRGNVPDRLNQMDAGSYDALILAVAGMVRLGKERSIAQIFSLAEFAPAPGQGALALVVRSDDLELRRALEPMDLGNRKGLPWAQAKST